MEEIVVKKYDAIVIDSVNFAYKTFKINDELPVRISKKTVYKDSICNFINSVEDLKNKYLKSDGQVYLLFDNYFNLRCVFLCCFRTLSTAYGSSKAKV